MWIRLTFGKSVLWRRWVRSGLCHTFPQGRSQRWLRIFKNAFNMVSICPWRLHVKLLSGKKHRFVRLSRNLAFQFRENLIKMTLRNEKALKTCSELIGAHPIELPAWNRSMVDIMTQHKSNIYRGSSRTITERYSVISRPNPILLRASLVRVIENDRRLSPLHVCPRANI